METVVRPRPDHDVWIMAARSPIQSRRYHFPNRRSNADGQAMMGYVR
ncbi:MAG: hypothetical protein AVDCRST_MAG87-3628 [uncultured Thermomicrobiales bacterium]|uniref:Uncharacterized protein n=1 Tax=uncultured Thermomicrobiales bacterium TaxID=1645740 RepID=A0A6J4VNP2_9BACT|nr:MAG: hypothetical protein AVDCRST_MAG87-3628 [uncultured Thermomicrobiales bacterium]